MIKYAYEKPDGSIGVIRAKSGFDISYLLPDEAVLIGTVEDLPPRYFRSCWQHDGVSGITVDIDDARICKLQKVRDERDVLFDSFDKIYAGKLAIYKDFNHEEVLAADGPRQQLRDIPQSVSGDIYALEDLEDLINYDAFTSVSGIL